MNLTLLDKTLAVCRLEPNSPLPDWIGGDFFSITRSSEEISIVCEQALVPEDVKSERDWRAFKVAGPLLFDQIGVLASLAEPLAEAELGIFVVSTFDTDYILVKEAELSAAREALKGAGHSIT